jgi:hypothetical protein
MNPPISAAGWRSRSRLGKWAFEHLTDIQGARTSFDARREKS